MSTTNPKPPRRVRVERNVYRRPDGRLEVGYRDSASKQRWKGPFEHHHGGAAPNATPILGAKAKGERVSAGRLD